MKVIGNEIYIQRGEKFSFDFAVKDEKGNPLVPSMQWQNPYLLITISSALYSQKGVSRESYWLDLDRGYVEQADGNMELTKLKRFVASEPLWLPNGFSAGDAYTLYDPITVNEDADTDICNYLFFTDPYSDGKLVYRYLENYVYLNDKFSDVKWSDDYDFRIIKQFDSQAWTESKYLYDIKIVAGESVQERIIAILASQGYTVSSLAWTHDDWLNYIELINDERLREAIGKLYEDGVPLMPDYDVEQILLEPTPIYVGANLRGGNK